MTVYSSSDGSTVKELFYICNIFHFTDKI